MTPAKEQAEKFIHGTRPLHSHIDPSNDQKWECNSPYCTDVTALHPDNGGPTPIVQGYEFWKGR